MQIAFENVQNIVSANKKLSLEEDELFYVRAFYEHGVEKWSYGNFDGAKELLFVLSNIITDELLVQSLQAHIVAISKEQDLDSFYDKEVDLNAVNSDEKYGYFITAYNYDLKKSFITK